MKTRFINAVSGVLSRTGPVTMARITGYWISQMLASYFVSGAIIGVSSKITAALSLVLFATLFVLHSARPWSRPAAILGLFSFAAFTAMIVGLFSPAFGALAPSVELMILISAGLAIWGIAVDAFHATHH